MAQDFKRGEPFRHVVIPDFFSPGVAKRMLEEFPGFEERSAMGETGEVGRKAARSDVRDISDIYRQVDDFLQTSEFLGLMSEITGIPDLLYDAEYHGGGTHENLHGQGMYTHVDFNYHPNGWHRRLNLIIYLNPEWEVDWGGNLTLHSNGWDPSADTAKSIPPLFNQGVLFETSEHSWHGFSHVNLPEDRRHLSRKSFAVYLYTKERTAAETAAAHSTIYVPDGIPDDIEPGTVLSQEQYQLLRRRFNGFRSMLKHQYERQQHLSEVTDTFIAENRRLNEEHQRLAEQVQALNQRYERSNEYLELALRIRDVSQKALPGGATVLVISRGDESLAQLVDAACWHFPRDEAGGYAGHYPADDRAAIEHLEDLRGQGAQYLLLPVHAFWWLEYYPEFAKHLENRYPKTVDLDDTCCIFELT